MLLLLESSFDKGRLSAIKVYLGLNKSIFPGVPNRNNVLMHDIDVGSSSPVKQHKCHVNSIKIKNKSAIHVSQRYN